MIKDTQFKEGDWMECRGRSIISKIIRLRCGTASNHGQPLHYTNNHWYVLDQEAPRLKTTLLNDEIDSAKNNKFDFYICRQVYETPDTSYINAATIYDSMIYKKRPYYDIWALIKFLFTLPKLIERYKELVKIASNCYTVQALKEVNASEIQIEKEINIRIRTSAVTSQEWKEFCYLFDKNVGDLYYCTEHWKNIWKGTGMDVFKKLYGVDYCTPIEAEKFSKDHCMYLCGIYNGQESDQLWKMI